MTLSREQEAEIRAQFADIRFVVSNRIADYYTVGGDRSIMVSARHQSGRYLCHTHRANECEHTRRVEEYEKIFGTPETRRTVETAETTEAGCRDG